jgi:hypothetical protein
MSKQKIARALCGIVQLRDHDVHTRLAAQDSQQRSGALRFLQGLPFDKERLAPDVVAGITLAALGIPEVMGYRKIIGTPVITGLYTLFLPVVVFAVFGSSRHLVVSADSATAAMVAAALTSLSFTANTQRYIELTSFMASSSPPFSFSPGFSGSGSSPISSPAPCSRLLIGSWRAGGRR